MRFWFIDVDPFGSPAPFIRSAARAVRIGGVIAATATDEPPLFGIKPRKLLRMYGVWGFKTDYHKEFGLRALMGFVVRELAMLDLSARPIFSHITKHYVRAYFAIERGAERAKALMREMMGWILHCSNCLHREILQDMFQIPTLMKCPSGGSMTSLLCPVWIGPVLDEELASGLPDLLPEESWAYGESREIVERVLGEANAPPLYYSIPILSSLLGLSPPKTIEVVEALRELGYSAVISHIDNRLVKTDAPAWEVKNVISSLRGK